MVEALVLCGGCLQTLFLHNGQAWYTVKRKKIDRMWGIAVEILAGVEDEITPEAPVKKKRNQPKA